MTDTLGHVQKVRQNGILDRLAVLQGLTQVVKMADAMYAHAYSPLRSAEEDP